MATPELGSTDHVAGVATNVHVEGDGPPILLLHGSGPGVTAWANWRLTIPVLGRRFQAIAPDIIGFGFTERPEVVTYDLDTWTAHAVGVPFTITPDGTPRGGIGRRSRPWRTCSTCSPATAH
jgi:2-hydroxymuconate-semialdehyde hydrolase